jgi:glycerol-3-phosphate acyltransferase PlsX
MGGDIGPLITIPAVTSTARKHPNIRFVLFGQAKIINDHLDKSSDFSPEQITIVDCEQTVAMDESPLSALRHKSQSSMAMCIKHVEQGGADACVSAGNTGALMAMANYYLKTLPGIDRPALISSIPISDDHSVYLLDLGANVNSDSEILFQYAVMGSVLSEAVGGISNPRIALLNVGAEQIKGNDKVKNAAQLLVDAPELNYIGFVEGNDIFSHNADVIVTDGFTGNVALKSSEGLAKLVLSELKRISDANWTNRLLAKIALPLLKKVVKQMNPDQYNGASLIGLRGIVVKSHGNASVEAFCYAIEEAIHQATRQVPTRIKNRIETLLIERP